LPNREELESLQEDLIAATPLPHVLVETLRLIPKTASPMHVLRTAVSMLGTLDHEADLNMPEANRRKAIELTARLPVIVAKYHRLRQGLPIVPPSPKFNTAANFLY